MRIAGRQRIGASDRLRPIQISRSRPGSGASSAECWIEDFRREQRRRPLPAKPQSEQQIGNPQRENFALGSGAEMISARRRLRCQGDRIAGALRQLLQRAEERGEVAGSGASSRRSASQSRSASSRASCPARERHNRCRRPAGPGSSAAARCSASRKAPSSSRNRRTLAPAAAARSASRLRSAPAKGGFWAQDAVEQSEAGPGGEKGGGALLLRPQVDARP